MTRPRIATTAAAGVLLAVGAASSARAQLAQELPPLPPTPAASPFAPGAAIPPPIVPEAMGGEIVEVVEPAGPPGLLARWREHRRRKKLHLQEGALGFPEEFREPPLGHWVHAHGRVQVANGNAAQMILNDYDFIPGTDQLNLKGRDRLARMAARLPTTFDPLVVERTPGAPGLDLLRRQAVLAELAGGPFPVPAERVVVGPAIGLGLSGVHAEMVHQNLMIQTMTNGTLGGVGGGAIGGTAGQGFGAQGQSQPSRPR